MRADKTRMYRDVKFLTEIYPYRNHKNIQSLQKAADYIENGFKATGLPVYRQSWQANGHTYENVAAAYLPENKTRFVIGAHYDVYKEQDGADDNASAVAGLLEIARMLPQLKQKPAYGIDFVAFNLEEPPFFGTKMMGSYIHAKSMHETQREVIGMISLEMIGYYGKRKMADYGPDEPYPSEKNYLVVSGFRKHHQFNKKISGLLRAGQGMAARTVSFADDYRNNAPSDHRNYRQFGYPSVMIIGTSDEKNPNYHKPTDTIGTLDFDVMSKAVESCAYALYNFGTGE